MNIPPKNRRRYCLCGRSSTPAQSADYACNGVADPHASTASLHRSNGRFCFDFVIEKLLSEKELILKLYLIYFSSS
jgi:hypothetical protein